jgi:hypothetical protein
METLKSKSIEDFKDKVVLVLIIGMDTVRSFFKKQSKNRNDFK